MIARGWLIWLIALLAITWVGDRIVSSMLAPLVLRSQLRFSQLYRGGLSPDIVILGNSRAVNAFYSPRLSEETGVSVWNLGYNGMSTELAEAVFEDYLDLNEPPKLLVIEVTSVYSRHEALRDLRLYRRYSSRLRALDRRHDPKGAAVSRILHLFDFNNELFGRALYYQTRSDQTWINRGRISPAVLATLDTLRAVELQSRPENVTALERITRRANDAGTRVVLVVTPFLPAYVAKIVNYEEWTRTLSERLGGVYIWDFSAAVSEVEAFADRIHLNQAGSELLLHELQASGVLDVSDS